MVSLIRCCLLIYSTLALHSGGSQAGREFQGAPLCMKPCALFRAHVDIGHAVKYCTLIPVRTWQLSVCGSQFDRLCSLYLTCCAAHWMHLLSLPVVIMTPLLSPQSPSNALLAEGGSEHPTLKDNWDDAEGYYSEPLQYSVLQYSILQYSILHYSVLQYSVLQYSVLQYSVLQYSVLQYSVLQYSVLQYSVLQYSVLQYSVLQYSVYCMCAS